MCVYLYVCALDRAVKQRLELVKQQALETVRSLQTRAERTFKNLDDWLDARFLAEMGRSGPPVCENTLKPT